MAGERQRCDPDAESWVILDLDGCLAGEPRAVALVLEAVGRYEMAGGPLAALFTDGSGAALGRAEDEEAYDRLLDAASLEALAAFYNRGDPDGSYEGGFTVIEVERVGDRARVRGERLERFGFGEERLRRGVRAELERTDRGWRIVRLREWPLYWGDTEEERTYDQGSWARRDAAVERALGEVANDPTLDHRRRLVEALLAAMRYAEAEEALQPLLDEAPDAEAFEALSRVHLAFGRIPQARRAQASAESAR